MVSANDQSLPKTVTVELEKDDLVIQELVSSFGSGMKKDEDLTEVSNQDYLRGRFCKPCEIPALQGGEERKICFLKFLRTKELYRNLSCERIQI